MASLQVSSPSDPAEREAQTTAQRIVGTATPDSSIGAPRTAELQRSFQSPYLMRFAGSGIFAQTTGPATQRVYRKEQGQPAVTSNTAADIRGSEGGGSPLPLGVRQFMEPRFGADFSGVKIHTGDKSASLNRQLSADAFAVGNNIFFGKDKFQPGSHDGRELIAHELTHTLQEGAVVRRRTVEVAGKTMYVASDGELVELPPDMTDAEATKLEAQAKAAEKKLGKGPAPKPVPDVKKLAKKEEKKGKPKPLAKGKKSAAGKGKGGPKGGAGMAKLKVGPGKVAQYLAAKATPTLAKGIAVLQKLKQNEQTHDDAAEKLKQSEKAVVIPPSEGQSKSNTGQVATVNSYPPPAVDEKKGKQQLQDSLEENFPQTIEDVDNFKRDRKAQHMGADVMKVVQSDKNAVSSTFQEMEQTPPPIPPETPPEALPPEELAPPTANMDLGQGAVPSLQKQHTDVTSYSKEADARLKEEGVTQEQLDMVDSGDLAEANKEKKGLQQAVQTQPVAVQKFAQREADTVQKDLKQEEKKERDALKTKRKAGLSATAKKQLEAKKALEKKREEVASKINGIFQTAQDKVKKKLADLENESMKRFDDGNAQATRQFEDNVNRELGAFKAERYSGWFGRAKKAKDWLWGMDELPEVKDIFDRNRTVFVNTINQLVEDISLDNKRVIQECKDELAAATKAIKEYVDTLEPGLKDIGNKTAEEMNGKLQELDQFVNKKEEELRDKLKDKQTAAIKAIDEKIEKMKEAMSGALSKLGKLLLAAAKKFFTWALEKCGVSLSTIEGIINKGTAVLKAIFTQPVKFVKNLMNAAITGFKNFGSNFLKHLKDALFEWLTGSLEGLVLPKTWNFQGIIGVALQMIGISYQNIRKHMVTVMTEPVVVGLEKSFTLVKTLITEGPMAAWEQLKEMAGEMRDAFVEAVKDFIKTKIVEQAIQWLVGLFIPGAGIIKAIIGIYDTIVFFIQKAKQIMQMISNFLGSISEIAAGNIGAAASAMESGLARGLSLVISFLAQLLRMSGITDKIKNALEKIRTKVDAVLLKVAKWIAEKAKKLGKSVAQAGLPQDPNERLRLGLEAAESAVNSLKDTAVTASLINPVLAVIKVRYGFQTLQPVEKDGDWWVEGQINPAASKKTRKRVSVQGTAVAAAIIGQNVETAKLPTEYGTVTYDGKVDIRRSGRGYSVPELSCDRNGLIKTGRDIRRADYFLIDEYTVETTKIGSDIATLGRTVKGNPASLVSDLHQRVQAAQHPMANGIRSQMKRIRDFLRGPNRLEFTGAEVQIGKKRSADYTITVTDNGVIKNVIVEVKNWSTIQDADDLIDKGARLTDQLSSYIRLAKTAANNYDIIRVEWIGFSKLDDPSQRKFKGIITAQKGQATRKGIVLEFLPM